jgi:DNA-binding NarL/FixJ family response regulator
MAVLSEPVAHVPASSGRYCVIVSLGAAKTQARINVTLQEHNTEIELIQVEGPDEAIGLGLDAQATVILICDVDQPQEMATLRCLRRELRGPAIVAVSPAATATGVRRALDAGADAVVFESELEQTLAVAVSAVESGQSVVPRNMRASVERPAFSHRERQVLTFVSQGLTNAEIAEQLFLSESTVKSHLSSAFAKIGVRSRREAAALFIELEQAHAQGGATA